MTSAPHKHSLHYLEVGQEGNAAKLDQPPSLSSSSPRSSDVGIMGRVKGKLGLCLAIVGLVALTTWQMRVPRYKRDQIESEIAWIKPETLSNTILNKSSASVVISEEFQDSVFRFPDDDDDDEHNDDQIDDRSDDHEDEHGDEDVRHATQNEPKNEPKIETYFSSMSKSFGDVPIGPDKSIPTLPFLDACIGTVQLFRSMHKMILDRVVRDIEGNVEKLHHNYAAFPEESQTLQRMVIFELSNGPPEDEGQATVLALTWLKRAFHFLSRFLFYIEDGEEQSECARKAYEETLRQYHGFATRAIFKAAFLTLSTRLAFLQDLAVHEADITLPGFEEVAMADLRAYNKALSERLKVLEDFFFEYHIPD